jgi:hypothetical protein
MPDAALIIIALAVANAASKVFAKTASPFTFSKIIRPLLNDSSARAGLHCSVPNFKVPPGVGLDSVLGSFDRGWLILNS